MSSNLRWESCLAFSYQRRLYRFRLPRLGLDLGVFSVVDVICLARGVVECLFAFRWLRDLEGAPEEGT